MSSAIGYCLIQIYFQCDKESHEVVTVESDISVEIPIEVPTESHIEVPDLLLVEEIEDTEEVVELDEGKGEIVVIGRRRNNSIPKDPFEESRRSFTRRNGICQVSPTLLDLMVFNGCQSPKSPIVQ